MPNRKKRLKKGIESIKKQLEIHENKKQKAEELGMEDLVGYYIKEIESKKKDIAKKESYLK